MEVRELELIAEGSALGDSFILQVEHPKERIHLNKKMDLELRLVQDGDSDLPDILRFENGLQAESAEEKINGSRNEDGSISFIVPVILRGKKGESMLKVLIKGEEFRATLAINEFEMKVHPDWIDVAIEGIPILWERGNDLTLPLVLSHDTNKKTLVKALISLTDSRSGEDITSQKCEVSFKQRTGIPVEFKEDLPDDPTGMNATIRLKVDGEYQETTIENAVEPVLSGVEDIDIKEKENSLSPEGPDDGEGAISISIRADQKVLAPGSELRIILDVTGDLGNDIVNAWLDLEVKGFDPIDLGELERSGHIETDLNIPGSIKIGDVAGKLELKRDGETILREVFSRLFTVSTTSTLDMDILFPGFDMDRKGLQKYLLPNEKVLSRRSYSNIELLELNSGKVLVTEDDRPVPEGEKNLAMLRNIFVTDTFLNTILDSDIPEKMEREFSMNMELIRDHGIEKDTNPEDLKGPVGSFLSLISRGVKEPAVDTTTQEKNIVTSLSGLIKDLLSPSGDDDDVPSKLRKFIEDQVRSMKKVEGTPSRETYLSGLDQLSLRGQDTFKKIRMVKKTSMDTKEAEELMRRTIFYLLLQGLYMVEITSKWSDPVVNTWEPLRIERQHMIKSSIQRLFNLTDRICDIRNSGTRRWKAYNTNLKRRRVFRSLSLMETKRSREVLTGVPGGSWDMLISFRSSQEAEALTFTPYLSLPRGGWALESPSSMREGNNLVLKEVKIGPGDRRDIEFKIRAPSNPGVGERAKLYLHLENMEMEVEE